MAGEERMMGALNIAFAPEVLAAEAGLTIAAGSPPGTGGFSSEALAAEAGLYVNAGDLTPPLPTTEIPASPGREAAGPSQALTLESIYNELQMIKRLVSRSDGTVMPPSRGTRAVYVPLYPPLCGTWVTAGEHCTLNRFPNRALGDRFSDPAGMSFPEEVEIERLSIGRTLPAPDETALAAQVGREVARELRNRLGNNSSGVSRGAAQLVRLAINAALFELATPAATGDSPK